jgi:hypothetical protein
MPEYDWTDYVGGILCAVLAAIATHIIWMAFVRDNW